MNKRQFLFALPSALLLTTLPLQAASKKTLAVWDFDGTIIRGDCSEGLFLDGKPIFEGLVARSIQAGFSKDFKGKEGVKQFFALYEDKIAKGKVLEAYGDILRIFAGTEEAELERFCEKQFQDLKKYYFARSMYNLRDLAAKGVENHIISASPEVFVRAAAKSLGLPKSRFHGIRCAISNGKITSQILEPFPYAEGKTIVMRAIEKERNGKALYGFGNSYSTDGAFLLAIAKQGGKSTMINGGKARPGMTEHFDCRTYHECVGD